MGGVLPEDPGAALAATARQHARIQRIRDYIRIGYSARPDGDPPLARAARARCARALRRAGALAAAPHAGRAGRSRCGRSRPGTSSRSAVSPPSSTEAREAGPLQPAEQRLRQAPGAVLAPRPRRGARGSPPVRDRGRERRGGSARAPAGARGLRRSRGRPDRDAGSAAGARGRGQPRAQAGVPLAHRRVGRLLPDGASGGVPHLGLRRLRRPGSRRARLPRARWRASSRGPIRRRSLASDGPIPGAACGRGTSLPCPIRRPCHRSRSIACPCRRTCARRSWGGARSGTTRATAARSPATSAAWSASRRDAGGPSRPGAWRPRWVDTSRDWGVDAVEFYDNNFFTSEARCVEIAERIAGLGLAWWGEGRVDTLLRYDESSWRTMRASGLRMVFLGAESGSEETLAADGQGRHPPAGGHAGAGRPDAKARDRARVLLHRGQPPRARGGHRAHAGLRPRDQAASSGVRDHPVPLHAGAARRRPAATPLATAGSASPNRSTTGRPTGGRRPRCAAASACPGCARAGGGASATSSAC